MQELWKPIQDFEGYYEVSSLGNIRSVARHVLTHNGTRYYESRSIKPLLMPNGYLMVRLRVEGSLTSQYIHRLVAVAFLPNPDNLPEVNHKDEDKTHNGSDNLEWCSHDYNMNYKSDEHQARRSNYNTGDETFGVYTSGELVSWPNMARAAESVNINAGSISRALKGTPRSHEVRGIYFYLSRAEAEQKQKELI